MEFVFAKMAIHGNKTEIFVSQIAPMTLDQQEFSLEMDNANVWMIITGIRQTLHVMQTVIKSWLALQIQLILENVFVDNQQFGVFRKKSVSSIASILNFQQGRNNHMKFANAWRIQTGILPNFNVSLLVREYNIQPENWAKLRKMNVFVYLCMNGFLMKQFVGEFVMLTSLQLAYWQKMESVSALKMQNGISI